MSVRSRPCRAGSQAGQASLEYAAVLAVVAVVLVVAGVFTGTGAITNAVGRTLERGLCLVGGGDCYAVERQACTTSSSELGGRVGVELTFVKLGGRFGLLRQELSDGTVDVTLIDGVDAGPTAGVGAKAQLETGAATVAAGVGVSAEGRVDLSRRRLWHTAGPAEADRLEHTIRRWAVAQLATHAAPGLHGLVDVATRVTGVHLPSLPRADTIGLAAGAKGTVTAKLPGQVALSAGLEASLGGTRDLRTGRTTVALKLNGEASAALGGALEGTGVNLTGKAWASVVFDRHGTPLDLAVTVGGTPLPGIGAGVKSDPRRGGVKASDVEEETTHLDLTRADNRAVYDRLVSSLARPGRHDQAAAVLAAAEQLRAAGRRDRARYTTTSASYGLGGEAALGARVGAEAEVTRSSMRLVDAWTKPAGGVWEQRTDCLAHA